MRVASLVGQLAAPKPARRRVRDALDHRPEGEILDVRGALLLRNRASDADEGNPATNVAAY